MWTFIKDFFKGVADAIFLPPPSIADPDAMVGLKKSLDAVQDRYNEWGETFNEWGPENPWYDCPTVKTKDGLTFQERVKSCPTK